MPEEHRGKYLAFTYDDTDGMRHLQALADAGLTHLHLLPVFDIATINENEAERTEPDPDELALYPPNSKNSKRLSRRWLRWTALTGADPFHYTTPEGSYATDPNGTQRILEFRQMVQSLNGTICAYGNGCGLQPYQRLRAKAKISSRPRRTRLLSSS